MIVGTIPCCLLECFVNGLMELTCGLYILFSLLEWLQLRSLEAQLLTLFPEERYFNEVSYLHFDFY